MIQYFRNSIIAIAAILSAHLISCVDADSQFGNSLLPPEWEMSTDIDSSIMPMTYIFAMDSVATIPFGLNPNLNTSTLMVGSYIDPYVGRTSAQMFANYSPASLIGTNREFFGESPVLDSMILWLDLDAPIGDTTIATEFELYEVMSGDFRSTKIYYSNFDIKPYINDTALAKFSLKSPETVKLIMPKKFMDKFLHNDNVATNPYIHDSLFHEVFKGFYLRTKDVTTGEGAMYKFYLASSAMTLYYRNIVADTLSPQKLYFQMFDGTYYSTPYNTNFSMIQHDYSFADASREGVNQSQINDSTIQTQYAYVQGMAGLGTVVTLPKEQIEAMKAKVMAKGFSKIAILSAELIFEVENPYWENYNKMFGTIAPYKNMSELEFISDYKPFESNSPSSYDGKLNRSNGKYTINISSHVQQLFMGKTDNYKIQISGILGSHLSPYRSVLMGSASQKPPRLVITYTMIK